LNKNLLVLSFSFILPDIKAKTLVLKKFKKLNMGIEPAISVLTALSSTIVPQDPHILYFEQIAKYCLNSKTPGKKLGALQAFSSVHK
jgi:hypothetical protein